ncbi:MAG: ATP synthase F1 subunit delta [Planctomycetales bacterium]|nr:ATP synthase F1 subunit delta [Planctomycetales bacterium]MBN8627465.1 ATP synthase F1 subunit delta [Planctomycetota bacterium]
MAKSANNLKQAEELNEGAFSEPADIGLQPLASAYAKALFAAADKAGALDKVVNEFDSLVTEALDKYPKIVDVLASGMFSPEQKIDMIQRAFGGRTHPLLLNFLKVLASHDRSYILRSVREEFRKQYDKAKGIVPVRVVTAVPLPEKHAQAIADRIRSALGGQPILQPEVDPNLIGGVVVQIGDVVFDGSLSSSLARLREKLITRSVHEIQRRRDSVSTTAGN